MNNEPDGTDGINEPADTDVTDVTDGIDVVACM